MGSFNAQFQSRTKDPWLCPAVMVQDLIDWELYKWKVKVLLKALFALPLVQCILQSLFHSKEEKILYVGLRKIALHLYQVSLSYLQPGSELQAKGSSSSVEEIAAVEAPQQAKLLLWRTAVGALPTSEEIAKRISNEEEGCGLCDGGKDSTIHLFTQCQLAQVA